MGVKIVEVKTKRELRRFVRFPQVLYKDCEYFVPAIFRKEMFTLHKKKNPAFDFCDAKYWLAYKDDKIAGRIAGIINHDYNKKENEKNIRFGWLDFIEDEDIARKLLSCVEDWGKSQGLTKVTGPMGFVSFDRSGVLVEGFDEMQTAFGTYNYPYYNTYLEQNGYDKEADWIEFRIKMPDNIPQKILRGAEFVQKRYDLTDVQFNSKKDFLAYTDELFEVLNQTYHNVFGFVKLTPAIIENLKNEFYALLNTDWVSIIKNNKGEVVAFAVAVPSLGKALQKTGGKMFPFGFLHLSKAIKKNDSSELLLIGVRPDYQKKGVHSLIFKKLLSAMPKQGIKNVNVTKSLEDNVEIIRLWSEFDAVQNKRTRCYGKGIWD